MPTLVTVKLRPLLTPAGSGRLLFLSTLAVLAFNSSVLFFARFNDVDLLLCCRVGAEEVRPWLLEVTVAGVLAVCAGLDSVRA